jgi:hypothetical protein
MALSEQSTTTMPAELLLIFIRQLPHSVLTLHKQEGHTNWNQMN